MVLGIRNTQSLLGDTGVSKCVSIGPKGKERKNKMNYQPLAPSNWLTPLYIKLFSLGSHYLIAFKALEIYLKLPLPTLLYHPLALVASYTLFCYLSAKFTQLWIEPILDIRITQIFDWAERKDAELYESLTPKRSPLPIIRIPTLNPKPALDLNKEQASRDYQTDPPDDRKGLNGYSLPPRESGVFLWRVLSFNTRRPGGDFPK